MSENSSSNTAGFRQFNLAPPLLRGIEAAGFSEPRPIQAATIPAALDGRDVLGLAQTGTGKTAAFALPIFDRLLADKRRGPRALILAPTRELAMQIHTEFRTLAKFTPIKAMTIYGGVSARPQIRGLKAHPDVLIACPGRLLDLMQQGHVDLGRIDVLVLDEADHMFDIGFLPDIRRILKALPERRQNMLFSATMPAAIRGLADQQLYEPHVAELDHSAPASTIEHALYSVCSTRKVDLLRHVLTNDAVGSAIVFSRTRHRAKGLARQLSRMGYEAVALQGSMSQSQRDRAMNGFRNGRFDVLVATDVAARGIDVAQVSHVINFDMPTTPEAYTHRIGRTGRCDRGGKAYTFVCKDDLAAVRALERQLGKAITRRQAPGFGDGATEIPATRPGRPPRASKAPRRGSGKPAPRSHRTTDRTGGPLQSSERTVAGCDPRGAGSAAPMRAKPPSGQGSKQKPRRGSKGRARRRSRRQARGTVASGSHATA
ncbi:MAG: DEAD/DEAH box helicase [Candidatus Binatia bacterium]